MPPAAASTQSPQPANAPGASTPEPYQDEKQQDGNTEQVVKPGDLTLKEALDMYDTAKTYVDKGLRSSWDNYFKVFKGQRVIRNYDGISDPVIREAHTIIETLVSNIAGGNPHFQFVATNEEQSKDTAILNNMLDYYMECNQMDLKNQEWVREMLLYGTAILHVTWRDGKPWIENIPLRDFFVDPTSTCMVQGTNPARYAGYEYLADKDVLKREQVYSAEKQQWVDKYKNLDAVTAAGTYVGPDGTDHKKMDKAFKDMFAGSTLGEKATERQVHVIKLYDLLTGRLVEIGNRKGFIYNEPTWCQRKEKTRTVNVDVEVNGVMETAQVTQKLDEIKPFLPFAVLRDYVDTSQFYGEGEMAIIMGDSELLNDYESMDVDNNAYQNTPMYTIDPQFADLAAEIETIAGAVYPIPKGALTPIERPQLSGDLDKKKVQIVDRMRRATAADELIQGVAPEGSRTTATEVSATLTQAQNRFSTKISNLESEGYAQLGLIIFKLIQIFITRKTAIRIVGKMGIYFKDFDPWEYNGDYQPHVELDTTIKRKQMEVGMKRDQTYQILKDRPHFNPVEVDRWMVQSIDPTMTDEKFNAMLLPPSPPQAPEPTEHITFNYKDAPPFIKAQIEEKFEMRPDPQHAGEVRNTMLEQANRGADFMNPLTTADNAPVPGLEPPQPQPATVPSGMAA
jgi:hypothetical protein